MVSWYLAVMYSLYHWYILDVAVCALSPSSENCYIAYPSRSASSTVFSSTQTSQPYYVNGDIEIFDALSLQLVNIVQAHKSPISNIAMNADGTLLATASEKVGIFKDIVDDYSDWQGDELGHRDSCIFSTWSKQGVSIPPGILSCQDLFNDIQPLQHALVCLKWYWNGSHLQVVYRCCTYCKWQWQQWIWWWWWRWWRNGRLQWRSNTTWYTWT